MASQIEQVIKCPICQGTMTRPILQCQTGHSMCGDCIEANSVDNCPQCGAPLIKIRNYQLELLIENMAKNLKTLCFFADKGCRYELLPTEKAEHEAECKLRRFVCEGKTFAKWNCEWLGDYTQLEHHFKQVHRNTMEYKMQMDMDVNLREDNRDVQIISFFNGSQYFWYKYMVDVVREKVYWAFQFIGPKDQAKNYFYEFEINHGPTRKFKVTQVCDNDAVTAEELLRQEKCIVLSFAALRSYLNNQGKLSVKFRIMAVNKHSEAFQ